MSNTEVKLLSADCSAGFLGVRVGRRHAMKNRYDESQSGFFVD